MNQIDLSQMISPEQVAQARRERHAERIKAECRDRILEVIDWTTQMNLTAAAAAGLLSETNYQAWTDILRWIDGMRRACTEFIAQDRTDRAWPPAPAGAEELLRD